MLDKVKTALRINNSSFDEEIKSLISACKKDLELAGIEPSKIIITDNMIVQAIILYCKANFGFDNPESERFSKAYESMKSLLSLCASYS